MKQTLLLEFVVGGSDGASGAGAGAGAVVDCGDSAAVVGGVAGGKFISLSLPRYALMNFCPKRNALFLGLDCCGHWTRTCH